MRNRCFAFQVTSREQDPAWVDSRGLLHFCRRFAARELVLNESQGLSPLAIDGRRFAAKKMETWEVILYPTGITFFPNYLDLISTLRRKARYKTHDHQ